MNKDKQLLLDKLDETTEKVINIFRMKGIDDRYCEGIRRWLKSFFNSLQIQKLLDQGNFEELYNRWGSRAMNIKIGPLKIPTYPNAVLTSVFLTLNIDFLPYMSFIPICCFKGLDIKSISIPNNIKYIKDRAFGFCDKLNSITFQGNTDEWGKIHKDEFWCEGSNIRTIQCADGIIKL